MRSNLDQNVVMRRKPIFFDAVHRVVYEELNGIKPVPSDTTPLLYCYVKLYMFDQSVHHRVFYTEH